MKLSTALARRRLCSPALAIVLILAAGTACDREPAPAEDAEGEAAADAGSGTATAAAAGPQDAFWNALADLCGQAFEGTVVESVPADTVFANARLVMHVRQCDDDVMRIPFHVGEDRSRTWVLTRSEAGLRLKHDHRHADGTEDDVTQYGGDTDDEGSPTRQSFAADDATAALIPEAATNVWTLELEPGSRFAYALRREGTERRFRAEFDLARSVPAPPPPWGASE
jgi:hypothetical protein